MQCVRHEADALRQLSVVISSWRQITFFIGFIATFSGVRDEPEPPGGDGTPMPKKVMREIDHMRRRDGQSAEIFKPSWLPKAVEAGFSLGLIVLGFYLENLAMP